MYHLIYTSIIFVVVIALLLLAFFTVGRKKPRQQMNERELVVSCGDEGLLALYDQAATDDEREDIASFAKEKLALDQARLADVAAIADTADLPSDMPLATEQPFAEPSAAGIVFEPLITEPLLAEQTDEASVLESLAANATNMERLTAEQQDLEHYITARLTQLDESPSASPLVEPQQSDLPEPLAQGQLAAPIPDAAVAPAADFWQSNQSEPDNAMFWAAPNSENIAPTAAMPWPGADSSLPLSAEPPIGGYEGASQVNTAAMPWPGAGTDSSPPLSAELPVAGFEDANQVNTAGTMPQPPVLEPIIPAAFPPVSNRSVWTDNSAAAADLTAPSAAQFATPFSGVETAETPVIAAPTTLEQYIAAQFAQMGSSLPTAGQGFSTQAAEQTLVAGQANPPYRQEAVPTELNNTFAQDINNPEDTSIYYKSPEEL